MMHLIQMPFHCCHSLEFKSRSKFSEIIIISYLGKASYADRWSQYKKITLESSTFQIGIKIFPIRKRRIYDGTILNHIYFITRSIEHRLAYNANEIQSYIIITRDTLFLVGLKIPEMRRTNMIYIQKPKNK